MTMGRKAELEARIADDTAELERLNAEPDYERYRGMLAAFYSDGVIISAPFSENDRGLITDMLSARNHDPDVVALVQWACDRHNYWCDESPIETERVAVLAPFSAIKDN